MSLSRRTLGPRRKAEATPAPQPEDRILREARNFAALYATTGPFTVEEHAQMLKRWFEDRYAEEIAAALA